jgi:YHS domain-containing protein
LAFTRAQDEFSSCQKEVMSLLLGIVRFLFWVLVVSWSIRLLRRAIGWMLHLTMAAPPPGTDKFGVPQDTGTPRRLVRDPVCGMHVAEEVSLPLQEGNELVRFCSEACRNAYVGEVRKMAANGGMEFRAGRF